MIINRKLNESPIKISELRIGNIICNRLQVSKFIVSGVDIFSKKVNLFKVKKDKIEIEEKILDIKYIQGVELWGDLNSYYSVILKNILVTAKFIIFEEGYYRKEFNEFKFEIEDTFYSQDKSTILIYINNEIVCKQIFWYLHEIQNMIFEITKVHILEEYQDLIVEI